MPDGLNRVMLIGNLGTEPEMKYTANGAAVTTWRMAVSRSYGNNGERKEETEWFTVVVWNKLAETCGQHLTKGRKVYVEGRLASRSWESNGEKKYRTEVVGNQVLFLDKAGNGATVPDGIEDPDDLPFEM